MQLIGKQSVLAGSAVALVALVGVPGVAMAMSSNPLASGSTSNASSSSAGSTALAGSPNQAVDIQTIATSMAKGDPRTCRVLVLKLEQRLAARMAVITTGKGSVAALTARAATAAAAGQQLRSALLTYRATTVGQRLTFLQADQQEIQQLAAKFCTTTPTTG